MDIKAKFLELTTKTYPKGFEDQVIPLLGVELEKDEFGNYFKIIGESKTMFCSHLDTYEKIEPRTQCDVKHVIKDNIIKSDGTSILGADDKAGVVIMLYMIEQKVPGIYYFFLAEETGCEGSIKLAAKHRKDILANPKLAKQINHVISFDRKGKDSIISHQKRTRCCSEEFIEALCKEFNTLEKTFKYKGDDSGQSTDSRQFADIYPEITNISVGYINEHRFTEEQDIDHLEKLAKVCAKVKWDKLPAVRDPKVVEYKRFNYTTTKNDLDFEFLDIDNRFVSTVIYTQFSSSSPITYKKVNLSPKRISSEKMMIKRGLDLLNIDYTNLKWDGLELTYKVGNFQKEINRNSLLKFFPDLCYVTNNGIRKTVNKSVFNTIVPYVEEEEAEDERFKTSPPFVLNFDEQGFHD